MVRKMAYIGSSYLIGLFFASFFDYKNNILFSLIILSASLVLYFVFNNRYLKTTICLMSMSGAVMLYGLYDAFVYQNIIKYDGMDVEIKGEIVEHNEYDGDKSSYLIKGVINDDVRAYITCYTDTTAAEIGDSVSILGKTAVLEDSYTFPTKTYYKSKDIYLKLSKVHKLNYTENNGFSFRKTILQYRDHILRIIRRNIDNAYSGIMTAMLFGDKTGLESNEKTLMYRAGIGHIMAVSGVHLSVVCSFIWFFLSRIRMNKYLRFVLLLIPVLCFVFLAGLSNSVIRAAVMIAIVYGAELFRRKADTFNSLGLSAILLTVTSPFAVRDASFLLSVAGVFGIGVAAPMIIKETEEKIRLGNTAKSLLSSICVMVVVFPVTTLFFDEVSVISPVSNLLLLPVCEVILICGVIVTLTGGAAFAAVPVLKLCEVLCMIVAKVAGFIGGLRFSYIPLGDDYFNIITITFFAAAFAAVLCYRKKVYTVITSFVLFSVLILAVNISRVRPDDSITVAVIKDGASVSAIVHDNNSASVIDLKKGGKTAEYTAKYLNRKGIYKIDALVMNVDVNSSYVIYDNLFDLFEITSFMIPEDDRNLAGVERNNFYFYNPDSSFAIDNYSISFNSDETIIIGSGNSEILFCSSENNVSADGKYDAVVLYSGKTLSCGAETELIAAMNSKAEIHSENAQVICTDESLCFELEKDKKIRVEEIS